MPLVWLLSVLLIGFSRTACALQCRGKPVPLPADASRWVCNVTSCTARCNVGYYRRGAMTSTCNQTTGIWGPITGQCVAAGCGKQLPGNTTQPVAHAVWSCPNSTVPHGTECTATCEDPFYQHGNITAVCQFGKFNITPGAACHEIPMMCNGFPGAPGANQAWPDYCSFNIPADNWHPCVAFCVNGTEPFPVPSMASCLNVGNTPKWDKIVQGRCLNPAEVFCEGHPDPVPNAVWPDSCNNTVSVYKSCTATCVNGTQPTAAGPPTSVCRHVTLSPTHPTTSAIAPAFSIGGLSQFWEVAEGGCA